MMNFEKFQELIKNEDYVENGYWNDDYGQEFYEVQFMNNVGKGLLSEYNIIAEASPQGCGRIGTEL